MCNINAKSKEGKVSHIPELGEALPLVLPPALIVPFLLPFPRALAQLLRRFVCGPPRRRRRPRRLAAVLGRQLSQGDGFPHIRHGRVGRSMPGLPALVVHGERGLHLV